MAYVVHNCARFCNDSKHSHEQTPNRTVRHLLGITRKRKGKIQGIIYRPDKRNSDKVFVDAYFVGDWNKSLSGEPTYVMSRTRYIIFYAHCPIICYSKLQTQITLSDTESEYVVLLQSLSNVIPLTELLAIRHPVLCMYP